jgi:cell wall-associated NlpC family hydrolase
LSLILFLAGLGASWKDDALAQTLGEAMVDQAKTLIGVPYRFGEESPQKGFDSSGLVYYLHNQQGMTIPRTVKGQAQGGQTVSISRLAPGDVLIFKDSNGNPSVSALYMGDGKAVTSLPSTGVSVHPVETNWAKQHFLTAKRYVGLENTQQKTSGPSGGKNSSYSDTVSSNTLADRIIKTAEKYLGTPYRYGAKAGSGYFDCSLFTQTVFAENGIKLPRNSRQQSQVGTYVNWGEWKKGDLLFFWTRASGKGTVGHVAIYAGDGYIIHTYGKPGVTYSKITDRAWKETYMGAKRVLP